MFIGEGSLLAHCADAFRAAGNASRAVMTADPALLRWAEERGLSTIDPSGDLVALLSVLSFKYLFSIVNLRVLPASLLALPRRLSVNYHDGPLPRYVGVHATSWALMHGEHEHNITWHTMEPAVDAGAVLKHVTFAVGPRATAPSLNAACYEAALHSFAELVPELTTGTATLEPQADERRSYFGRSRRPAAAAVLDWRVPVHTLDALVRALDFGPYENALGLPKLLSLAGEAVVVQKATVLPGPDGAEAGTVLEVTDCALTVAGVDGALRLERIATLEGARLDGAALAALGFVAGARLPVLSDALTKRLSMAQRAVAKHEPFWIERLATAARAALAERWATAPAERLALNQALPHALPSLLARAAGNGAAADAVALAFASFVARESGASCNIALRNGALAAPLEGVPPLFASAVPLRVHAPDVQGRPAPLRMLRGELELVRSAGTHGRDVYALIPALRGAARATGPPPIALCIHDAGWTCLEPATAGLCVCIEPDGTLLRWRNELGPGVAALRVLQARFARFVTSLAGAALGADAPAVPPLSARVLRPA